MLELVHVGNPCNDFDEFWRQYPRRIAKKDARRAFLKIRWTPVLWHEVMAAIEAWKASEQWQRGFIPHPATWLNGERWNDELEVSHQPCGWPRCKNNGANPWGRSDKEYCELHIAAFKRGETP